MDGLEVLPVRGIGDVTVGDDLADLITRAAPWLRDGDVLVVTSKIVSKSEGRLVDVPADGPEREAARQEVLAGETARVVARRGPTTIVQTHHGFVMAAAGIDASNVDKTHLVLLPVDPDASARALRTALHDRGLNVAVIVSDTMGRAWRNGLTDVALGSAGISPFRDHRGEIDPYGNELQLTQMAVVDELAAAGELVKGKCDQVPVAVVRGYPGVGAADAPGAQVLLRDAASDMFSLGTAEARVAGLREAATLRADPVAPAEPRDGETSRSETSHGETSQGETSHEETSHGETGDGEAVRVRRAAVQRALALVRGHFTPGTVVEVGDGAVRLAPTPAAGPTPAADPTPSATPTPAAGPALWMGLGADAHRLRSALAAEGVPSVAEPDQSGITVTLGA